MILSHHSRFTCDCNKQEVDDDDDDAGGAGGGLGRGAGLHGPDLKTNIIKKANGSLVWRPYRGTSLIRKRQPRLGPPQGPRQSPAVGS